MARKMNPNSLANLTPGNPGNKGGGQSYMVRETKQAFLDAIKAVEYKDAEGNVQLVGESLKLTMAMNAVNPAPQFQKTRIWLSEMQHGQPNAVTELIVANEQLHHALAHALFENEIDPEKADGVIASFVRLLNADVG